MRLQYTLAAALLLLACYARALTPEKPADDSETELQPQKQKAKDEEEEGVVKKVSLDVNDLDSSELLLTEEDAEADGEDLHSIYEQLRQITTLRETIKALLPPGDSFDKNAAKSVKSTSSEAESDEEEDRFGFSASQNLIDKDDEEDSWGEEKLEDLPPEEPPEPLTPEEKEAEDMFIKAKAILKMTRPNKEEGYKLLVGAATLGHKKARSVQAWAQLLGPHIGSSSLYSQDIPAAVQTFKDLVGTGLPSAHAGMGFLYATGLGGVNASQAKALLHYKMAALGGDYRAQMVMGYRYWSGVTVPASCEKALDFYRKVANQVAQSVSLSGGPIVHRIRLLDEHESPSHSSGIFDQDLLEYYQLLAEKGDQQAQVGLGQLHYQGGRGVPIDHERALHYFQSAANSGSASAQAFLGRIYLEGSDVIKQNNETALKYFQKAAEQNNPMGLSGLGLMYLHGRGVEKDASKAYQYFSKAAEQGWVDGQLQLGNMYFSGTGVKRDFAVANKYFNLASQSGHVLAFYNLAQMHATGIGVMPSCNTAVELMKNVAERGKFSEHLMTAHTDYREGRVDEAFVTYYLLAEMGYEVAQSNAAFILDRGETSILSEEEGLGRALTLWGRAAAQGYSAAQVKLGDAHYYGRGTKVDYEAAASHYHAASEQQHNAQAMFNLGYMHERGLGLKKDRHLAKRRYDEAAEANVDARVPVALALVKLYVLFGVDYLQDMALFQELSKLDESLVDSWDLILIAIFSIILSYILILRRPQLVQQRGVPRPAAVPVN